MNKLCEDIVIELREDYLLEVYQYVYDKGIILRAISHLSLDKIFDVEGLIGAQFVQSNNTGDVYLFRWNT